MLPRVLEPEVMDTATDAADYDAMDHSGVNAVFAADFLKAYSGNGPVLDVGTGTAQIPIEIARRHESVKIVGIDLAERMLELAAANVSNAGFAGRIAVELVNARGLPYEDGRFPAVVSNSIIHHIPEPRDCFKEMVRVCMAGGTLFVRDLLRPGSKEILDHQVAMYAGNDSPRQRQLFADSLHAALTLDEVRQMVTELGFEAKSVTQTSDRHWTWHAVKHA